MKNRTKKDYPFGEMVWTERSKIFASMIPASVFVVDLGAGNEELSRHLRQPNIYFPIDKFACTDQTILADFNEGDYPDTGIDEKDLLRSWVVVQGLIEYLDDADSFLQKIHMYGEHLVISYRTLVGQPPMSRPKPFTFKEIEGKIRAAGWEVMTFQDIGYNKKGDSIQKIYLCRKQK